MDWGLANALGITAMAVLGIWALYRAHGRWPKDGQRHRGTKG